MSSEAQYKNVKQKSPYTLIRNNWNIQDKISVFSANEVALFERLLRRATEVKFAPFKMTNWEAMGLTRLGMDSLNKARNELYKRGILVPHPGGKGRGDITCYEFAIYDESSIKSVCHSINKEDIDSNNESPKDSKLGSENENLYPFQDNNNNLNKTKSSSEEEKEEENFVKPTKRDVVAYAETKNYDTKYAEDFYNTNSANGWLDYRGKPIHDWKIYFDNYVKKLKKQIAYSPTFTHVEGLKSAQESIERGRKDESEDARFEFNKQRIESGTGVCKEEETWYYEELKKRKKL